MRTRRGLLGLAGLLALLLAAVLVYTIGAPPAPEGVERTTFLGISSPARTPDPQTFRIAPGAPFEAQVTFGNETGIPMRFALLCLVDYHQTPCTPGQQPAGSRFELATGMHEIHPVALAGLSPGLHDVLVIVFYVPEAHSSDPQFRSDSQFLYTFQRLNVLVGDAEQPPDIAYQPLGMPDATAAQGINALALTQAEQTPWRAATLAAGQTLPFHLEWHNVQATPTTIALVALLDYQQVPVVPEHPVLYGQLAGQTRAEVAGRVTAPLQPGPHEFLLLVIESPYVALAQLPGSPAPAPIFVHSSERVLLTTH